MAYEKIGFSAGQVLKAEDLNHIEEGIQNKQDKITGAASTITGTNLTTNRVLITDYYGKIGVSAVQGYKLDYLTNVESDIQEQIDQAKLYAQFVLPGALEWNGAIEDRDHVLVASLEGMSIHFVRIGDLSDEAHSMFVSLGENIVNLEFECVCLLNDYMSPEIITGNFVFTEDGVGAFIPHDTTVNSGGEYAVMYIPQDNYILDLGSDVDVLTLTFPKRGFYSASLTASEMSIGIPVFYCACFSIPEAQSLLEDAECNYFEKVETVVGTTSIGDTLTWNGEIGNRDNFIVESNTNGESFSLIRVSSSIPTYEELISATKQTKYINSNGETTVDNSNIYISQQENGVIEIADIDWIHAYIIPTDNFDLGNNLIVPKAGIYFSKLVLTEGYLYTSSLQVEGYNFLIEETTKETVLKTKCLPADLRHVGSAFNTIKEGSDTIEYDGEIEDKLVVKIAEDIDGAIYFVHVSDMVPDINALLSLEGTGTLYYGGEYRTTSALMTKLVDGVYGCIVEGFDIPVIVLAEQDNINVVYNSEIINIPKKGIYFFNLAGFIYVSSVTHPAIVPKRAELKESALPDSAKNYVVRLPADTPYEIITNPSNNSEIRVVVEESYDNFANILYNGGQIMIDATQLSLVPNSNLATVLPTVWSLTGETLVGACLSVDSYGGAMVYSFYFPNGTWTSNN